MKYVTRSTVLFLMLYSLVIFAAGNLYLDEGISLVAGSRIAIAILLLQYLLGPVLIRAILDIDWNIGLPVRNQQFLEALCRREEIPLPRIGVIQGSVPNAFTFGRSRSGACIVVTTGLLDVLSQEEADAVIAHEVGHIKHRDFVVMTAAAMAPMALFQIYLWARRLKEDHWGTWAAFATYWAAEIVVLTLSRTREFWADAFSAEATGNPSALSSALVKISYGVSKAQRESAWARHFGNVHQKVEPLAGAALTGRLGALAIVAPEAALPLKGLTAESAAKLMKWDLVNPWARVHQYFSTHPLTAFRVSALNRLAYQKGRAAALPLPEWARIEWRAFPAEFLLWGAPWVLAFLLVIAAGLAQRGILAVPPLWFAAGAAALFGTWAARILYRYRGSFEDATIAELLEDTVSSGMRPRAVRIEGWITGRGDPGMFWSPDLLLRDDSGTIFLYDRESIPFSRMLLIPDASGMIGQPVTVEGWYRREPTPYVEISKISCEGEPELRSSSRWIQLAVAALASAGLYWILAASL